MASDKVLMIGEGLIVTALFDDTDMDDEEDMVSSWNWIHSEGKGDGLESGS